MGWGSIWRCGGYFNGLGKRLKIWIREKNEDGNVEEGIDVGFGVMEDELLIISECRIKNLTLVEF